MPELYVVKYVHITQQDNRLYMCLGCIVSNVSISRSHATDYVYGLYGVNCVLLTQQYKRLHRCVGYVV